MIISSEMFIADIGRNNSILRSVFVIAVFSCSVLQHVLFVAARQEETDGITLSDYEVKLRSSIFQNYSSQILPSHTIDSPVKVELDLNIITVLQLDEKTESLTLDAWLKTTWNDSRLSWERSDFGGLSHILVPHTKIWHPDVRLYNRVRLSEPESMSDVLAVIQHTGQVSWVSPRSFCSTCSIDLKFYPSDVQTCFLTFGSWNLNGQDIEMDLVRKDGKLEFTETFNSNNQWEIIGSRSTKNWKYLPCCKEPFSDVRFELRMRRRQFYYKFTTLYPSLGVAALTLATFWLPANSTDKLLLGGINFLVLVVLLVHLSWILPPAGKTVPMIVAFCGNMVMVVVSSMILSVISIIWSRTEYSKGGKRLPRWMRNLNQSILAKLLCTNSPTISSSSDEEPNSLENGLNLDGDDLKNLPTELEQQEFYNAEWMQSIQIFDRVNFLVFMVVIAFALAGSFTFNQ